MKNYSTFKTDDADSYLEKISAHTMDKRPILARFDKMATFLFAKAMRYIL